MGISRGLRPWILLFAGSVGVAIAMLAGASMALASTTLTNIGTAHEHAVCERAVSRWERISPVPAKLLHAISLAESGRWSADAKRVRAWPWTVTSGGPGSYFDSKEEALAEVRRLQAQGVTNIDVGCMQVNLHFHGHHFNSIEEAMDPDLNAAYAANFLTRLRRNAENWGEAAGHYHSMTPGRTERYRQKVERFWAGLRGGQIPQRDIAAKPDETSPTTHDAETRYRIVPIDRERTAKLNARFKEIRAAARTLREELDPNARRQRQLEAWRNASSRSTSLQHLLAMRKAELAKRQADRINRATSSDRQTRFEENRRRQLAQWRMRHTSSNP